VVTDRSETLFKLGVGLYVAGIAAALAGVAVLGRLIPLTLNANAVGTVLLILGLGAMAAGWILRKNTRGG
jgi:hypothetical protein